MPLSPEEKLRDMRVALENLHDTPGRWRSAASFMIHSRAAVHWRNTALQRLVAAGALERMGERRDTYYRVQEQTPIPSDEELSQILWPSATPSSNEDDLFGVEAQEQTQEAQEQAPQEPQSPIESLLEQVVEGVAGLTKLTAVMFTRLESVERRLVDQGAQNDMVLEAASKLEERTASFDLDKIGEAVASAAASTIVSAQARSQATQISLDRSIKTLNEVGEALQQGMTRNFQALAAGSSELAKSTVDALARNTTQVEAIAVAVDKLKAPRSVEGFELKVATSFKNLQRTLEEMVALTEENHDTMTLILTAVGRLIEQVRPDIVSKMAGSATGLPLVLAQQRPDDKRSKP